MPEAYPQGQLQECEGVSGTLLHITGHHGHLHESVLRRSLWGQSTDRPFLHQRARLQNHK